MVLCCWLNPSDVIPYEEALTAFLFVGVRVQVVAPRAAMVSNWAMCGEKALDMELT